ncbi:MAG: peroxiredoxin [Planctomycetota bacterium]
MLTVGDNFPEFSVQACCGIEDTDLTTLNSGTFEGKWKIFVFYPKDFTFVCPTELVEFGKRVHDFEDRDAVILGASTDNEFSHLAWRRSHEDLNSLPYPLLAAQKLARELGILDKAEEVCLRATFIVDPQGVIQYASVHNLSVGRNVEEVLRTLDAIQSDELCPCNWKQGEETISV